MFKVGSWWRRETWAGSQPPLLIVLGLAMKNPLVEDLGRGCVPRTWRGARHRPGYLHAWVIVTGFPCCLSPQTKGIVSGHEDASAVVTVRLCDLEI